MVIINLGLTSIPLYKGCEVTEVAGRLNLVTPPYEAINIVGKNIHALVASIPKENREEVILTGPMAVWSYLVVFHAVVHSFKKVYYDDGKNEPVLVAQHG